MAPIALFETGILFFHKSDIMQYLFWYSVLALFCISLARLLDNSLSLPPSKITPHHALSEPCLDKHELLQVIYGYGELLGTNVVIQKQSNTSAALYGRFLSFFSATNSTATPGPRVPNRGFFESLRHVFSDMRHIFPTGKAAKRPTSTMGGGQPQAQVDSEYRHVAGGIFVGSEVTDPQVIVGSEALLGTSNLTVVNDAAIPDEGDTLDELYDGYSADFVEGTKVTVVIDADQYMDERNPPSHREDSFAAGNFQGKEQEQACIFAFYTPTVSETSQHVGLVNAGPQPAIMYDGYEYDLPASSPSVGRESRPSAEGIGSRTRLAGHQTTRLAQSQHFILEDTEGYIKDYDPEIDFEDGHDAVLVSRDDEPADYEVSLSSAEEDGEWCRLTLENELKVDAWMDCTSTVADPNSHDIDELRDGSQQRYHLNGEQVIRPPPGFEAMGLWCIPSGSDMLKVPAGFEGLVPEYDISSIEFGQKQQGHIHHKLGPRHSALTALFRGNQVSAQTAQLCNVAVEEEAELVNPQYPFRPDSHIASDDSFYQGKGEVAEAPVSLILDMQVMQAGTLLNPSPMPPRQSLYLADGDDSFYDPEDKAVFDRQRYISNMQAMARTTTLAPLRQRRSAHTSCINNQDEEDANDRLGSGMSSEEHPDGSGASEHNEAVSPPTSSADSSVNEFRDVETVLKHVGEDIDALAANIEKLFHQLAKEERERRNEEEEAERRRLALESLP